ncbi:DUF418 domain-containing protein [Acetobacter conturbans]
MATDPVHDGRISRYVAIDGARGLGVLGIGLCNAPGFAAPMSQAETLPHFQSLASRLVWVMEQTVMQGRFVALFSLLFGLSMLWVGGDGRDPVANTRLNRRLCWLALFGVLHGALLWWGDILLPYALTGLVLRPCRGWSARRLLSVGGASYLAGVLLLRMDGLIALCRGGHVAASARPSQELSGSLLPEHVFSALTALLKENAGDWLTALPLSLPSVMLTSGPLMLIGMGLYRADYMLSCSSRRKAGWFFFGGAGAACASLPFALMQAGFLPSWSHLPAPDLNFFAVTVRLLVAPLGALGWLWLVDRMRLPQRALAPVGRLALSAYLGQSLLARFSLVLLPRFYGAASYGPLMMLALVLVLAQAMGAALWCRHGWPGPAEKLWRTLYRRPVDVSV